MYARVMYQHCLCLPTLPRKLNENDAKNVFLACENTKRLSTETRKCPQHYPRARQTGPSHGGLEAINGVLWTGLINPGSAWGREGQMVFVSLFSPLVLVLSGAIKLSASLDNYFILFLIYNTKSSLISFRLILFSFSQTYAMAPRKYK